MMNSWISVRDLYEILRLALQGMLAWMLPQAMWRPIARGLGWLNTAMHPARTAADKVQVAAVINDDPNGRRATDVAAAIWTNRYEERFQYLRAWRPMGWRPEIRIVGGEYVEAALANGHGILFWASNFSFNDLVTKMAWHRLGLRVSHFSRPSHGFSTTRFGVRYLNAVRRRVEDRYLGERLMTGERDTRQTLALLRERLATGGAVSFTVGARGRRTATARFLDAGLRLATGPLFLARSAGAVVLPVFTLRTGPGRFDVTFGPPVDLSADDAGEVQYDRAVQAYADMLAPYVARHPDQWKGWRFVVPAKEIAQ